MTIQETRVAPAGATPPNPEPIPPLENGDRLARPEFERRYNAMPHLKKAELIEGVVYLGSPVRWSRHAKQHGMIMMWVGTYGMATPGVEFGDNATVRLDLDNEPQPDVVVRIEAELGGSSQLSSDDYIEGPPELVVEVSASSASCDLHDKLRAYRRNAIPEYIIWRVLDGKVDWFRLTDGEYVPIVPDAEGIIRSEVFPGLQLAVPALLAGDLAAVLAKLQDGLAIPEHAAFVERLQAARKRRANPPSPETGESR